MVLLKNNIISNTYTMIYLKLLSIFLVGVVIVIAINYTKFKRG